MQVEKEYHILSEITEKRVVPVPQPLHCSTAAQERWDAGVDFIIMSYVEVWADFERVSVYNHAYWILYGYCSISIQYKYSNTVLHITLKYARPRSLYDDSCVVL